MVLMEYIEVSDIMELDQIANEMKQHAQAHPFDSKKAEDEAAADPNFKVEENDGLTRIKGYNPKGYYQQYNRFVMMTKPGESVPVQLAYTESKIEDDTFNCKQLTIVNNMGGPLEHLFITMIASVFFDELDDVKIFQKTPPHVAVLAVVQPLIGDGMFVFGKERTVQ
jgi:hypothetical protein